MNTRFRQTLHVFLALALLRSAVPALADARTDYLLHCGGCHLEDGSGNPPEVPDLRQNLDWLAQSEAGRSYLTRVPGASQVPISDARLAGVFNWIFGTFYPDAPELEPYDANEVAKTRHLPLYDPLAARRALAMSRPLAGR
jgi:mono/diheme cytochrome c family protein